MAGALHRVLPRFVTPCRIVTSVGDAVTNSVITETKAIDGGRRQCDVFINHRGVDTKRTVAGLVYDRLAQLNLCPFLDNRSMEPGDKLCDNISSAILDCHVGIAIFSPRYCESFFCLNELAMLVEAKKKLIPIFFDIKPSGLHVTDHPNLSTQAIQRFNNALREAKNTVGLTFDSQSGNWSELVTRTADIVVKSISNGR
ncbi:Toll/interleukin-1 receptor homology (TIR) domain-containing protein [Dioscorea alata]|uniref:Toll/interleukin-1 receptor homology (TIR) domain-containing protein n=1 Tax=Dioscorea alata TaxID=55571 RepID=A0ACB7UPE8_DIOAL|nr:Toll/interleukin-1 receptor homology (TIR) domain-containing protein [Dioscorea alata]